MHHTGAYTRTSPPPLEIPCTLRRTFRDVAADDVTVCTSPYVVAFSPPAFLVDVLAVMFNVTFYLLIVDILRL